MTEMQKLVLLLVEMRVPFEMAYQDFGDNNLYPQVWLPNKIDVKADIICHPWSYGGKDGLLEMMADFDNYDDDVKGYLTANEALDQVLEIAEREGFQPSIF